MMHELRCILITSVVAACGGVPTDEPIRIGVVTASTGDLAVAGHNQQDAVLLAIEEINAAGGVLGRPLALNAKDDGTTEEGASAAYSVLLGDDVSVILGPIHSAGVRAIARQIRSGRTLTISGGATSPGLTTLDDDGFFFRTVPSDAVQAIVLAQKILDAGRQNVCVVHRNDAYGMGLAEALREKLPSSTVTIVDSSYDPDASLSNVMAPCEPVRMATNPGVVFVTFEGDGRLILDAAAAAGWKADSHGIFLVDGNRRPELFAALRNVTAFEGVVGTAPSGPDPDSDAGLRLRDFQDRFLARWKRMAATNAENHYDSAYLAAIAIELAGSADDHDAIQNAMVRTASGARIEADDWAGLQATIASHDQVDFRGASGEVDLDADSGDPLPPYYVRLWTVRSGQIVDQEVVTIDR